MSACAEIYGIYGRAARRTAESSVRPARAAKRERPEKTFDSDRAAAFDGRTNSDHRPAVDAIGAMAPLAEIDCAYGVDAIGAMAARAEIDCACGRNPANKRAAIHRTQAPGDL